MARPYWWFKNQATKNAGCSRRIVLGFFFYLYLGGKTCLYFPNNLRGQKRNYKSVAKEISKPPFLAPEVQWASKFTVFVRFTFPLNVSGLTNPVTYNEKRI